MKTKILSFGIVLLLSIASCSAQDEAIEEITWNYDNGILTIGAGTMPDYGMTMNLVTTAPWGKHFRSIHTVVIERGVTTIGRNAFFGCEAIDSVSIANSVTKIGINAFSLCNNLKSVVLPYGVTIIDTCAFNDCGLVSITLPSSIKSIGDGALSCYDLTTVTNLNSVPLSLTTESDIFGVVDISTCTLQVPKQSVAAYQRAEVWKEFNIVGIEVEVEELRVESGALRVFPNPATGSCSIGMPDEFLYESVLTLSVYDASGKLVRQTILNNNGETPQLKMGLEAKGMYMVVLSNGKKEYRGKVVFN